MTVTPRASGGNEDSPDIVLNYQDSTHYWFIHPSAGSNTLDLYERFTFANPHSRSLAFSDNTAYVLKLVKIGTGLTVYVDGTERLLLTDLVLYADKNPFGLRVAQAGAPPGPCIWDNLVIQKIDAAPVSAALNINYFRRPGVMW